MSNEDEYLLYMILLENEKIFLYVSTPKDDSLVIQECLISYDFVRNNLPVQILKKTHIQAAMEVDFYVKRNMLEIGIDKVRGGTYSMEILPDFLLKTLELELSASLEKYKKDQDVFNDMYSKYSPEFLTNNEKRKNEIEKIKKELDKYNSILETKQLLDNDNKITRDVLTEIEWTMKKCASSEEEFIQNGRLEKSMSSSQEIDRYKKLLVIFKTLFTTFREHIDKPLLFQHMILIEHPQFILDTIFFNTEHITGDNKWFSEIRVVLEKYEYMAYSIINKIEEYEFDLSTFPNNFKQVSEYSLNLLIVT
jgi:hypothetical protein